ncbi:MAG: efflux RND transporter periplasmic adaptor subunit [Planctomycetia bacterium]|nr:efflux RND transporter periplasmic adaptor subunit [Planctomycetia bacterium]
MSTTLDPRTPAPGPTPSIEKLRELHARLAAQARAANQPERFFREFLTSTTAALDGTAGAVWIADRGSLRLAAEQHLSTDDRAHYERLAAEAFAEGAGRFVGRDGRTLGESRNENQPQAHTATQHDAVMSYPIRIGTAVLGIVSIGFADEPARGAQSALQRTLVPLCDHAADYLFRRRIDTNTTSDDRETSFAQRIAEFALEVHAPLDLRRTAAAIANEARRLTDSDRAGICVYRRRRAEAFAVSGQDYLDRRSNLVRRLETLAAAVAASGEKLRFPHDDTALAPQVESALHAYLDESQARELTVVPLRCGATATDEIVGVLTIEQIATAAPIPKPHISQSSDDRRQSPTMESTPHHEAEGLNLLESLIPHAATALTNALRYDAVPLRSLTRPFATLDAFTGGSRLKKRLLALGAAVGIVAALCVVPYDFAVEARGTLQPVDRRDVFASVDGIVNKIFIRHGDRVRVGDPLFELRSTDLDVAEADLIKEINETEQEFANAQRQYNEGRSLTAAEMQRLVGQIATLEQRRESLRRQATLFSEKRARLRVVSPMVGQVATWNIEELLAERPVRQGQTLAGLVDPDGEWEVEIRVPEDRFGHVAEKHRAGLPPLEITFVLATDPGHEYKGTVVETHLAAEPRGEEGNVVLVTAKIDKSLLAQLHPGADVRVRVECGSRSLGYVLLHDVWSFVQSRILFKL